MLTTRKRPGTSNRLPAKGRLTINCLRVTGPTTVFWHYDVKFEDKIPERAKWQLIDALQAQQRDTFKHRASFDGRSNLYSPQKLHDNSTIQFTVTYGPKEYQVMLTPVAVIDPKVLLLGQGNVDQNAALTAINLVNVLFKMAPAMQQGTVSNKRAFFLDYGHYSTGAIEFWRGYFQSIRSTVKGLILNVDTTVGLMYRRGLLLDVLMDHLGVNNVAHLVSHKDPKRQQKQITRFLKGLRVTFVHLRPKSPEKSIMEIKWESARDYKFFNNQLDKEMSVEEYFHTVVRHALKHPNLPILVKIGKAAYPLEMMEIVQGQPYRGLMPERAQSEMLKFATKKPKERLAALKGDLKLLKHQESSYLSHAQVEVAEEFIKVDARVLPQPRLAAGGQTLITPSNDGKWDMMRKTLHSPTSINKVFFVATDSRMNAVGNPGFLNRIMQTWSELGINIETRSWRFELLAGQEIDKALTDMMSNDKDLLEQGPKVPRPVAKIKDHPTREESESMREWDKLQARVFRSIVVVFLQDNDKYKREAIKHWSDIGRGWPTQILKANKALSGGDQYIRNVGLKINAKMGGINIAPSQPNTTVMPPDRRTMIFGIDTSHPAPGSSFPTTAAVTYSIDQPGVNYRAHVQFQPPRQEIVQGLDKIVLAAIQEMTRPPFNIVPRRIIVYRDGVSEGQFEHVCNQEIRPILAVLESMRRLDAFRLNNWPRPELTFIVVGKRHHIRLLPAGDTRILDRRDNAIPGTVVDDDITTNDPRVFDFYLQSHGSILGTSRPAHYSVLYDDANFDADTLESFSYDLCHVYQIATLSVSIPAPIYYADKVAARAPIHFHKILADDTFSSLSVDSVSYDDWVPHFKNAAVNPRARQRMYWL